MRALVPLALAALLSSCAALPAPPADGFDPAQYEGAPLRARIVSANGRLLVNTSRPAHVAIFEIIPGRGVGLLYPAYRGENNYFSGGLNTVHLTQSRLYYTYFQPAPFSRVGGPRYLYMIASDSPLRLSGLVSSPGALRRNLGLARFAGTQPYGLMEELADLVLSYGAPGDWAEDVYTIWDDRGYDTGGYVARDWIRIQCADGRILEGPAYYIYGACDQGRGYAPPLRNPEQPSDSGAVKPPTRRRPEPRDPSAEEGQGTKPPVVVPIPEPEPARRPAGGWTRDRTTAETRSTDSPRYRDQGSDSAPRVHRRAEPESRGSEPQVERRSEPVQAPRQEPRQQPRVESRPEPRSEPRVETPRETGSRVETRTEARSGGDPE